MDRPEYSFSLIINERLIKRVIIDQHYKEKHGDLDDAKILELIKNLDGQNFPIEASRGEFEYFRAAPIFLAEKPYRVVLVMHLADDFFGVINAFRIQGSL